MKKTIGYALLIISILAWVVIPIFPFLGMSTKEIAGATAISLVIGEIAFWASIVLLGKEAWEKIKKSFNKFWKTIKTK